MDGYQFDAFTRRIAAGTSRRQALRLGGGGLAAALLVLTGLREAAADDTPKPLGKKCRKDAQCASGYCDPVTEICAARPTGALTTADPTFNQCGPVAIAYYYDTYTYAHPGGPLSISLRGASSGGGTLVDPILHLFPHDLPAGPVCSGRITDDNNSGCGTDAYVAFGDLAAHTYTIVVTSFYPTSDTAPGHATGSYTLEFNTPLTC